MSDISVSGVSQQAQLKKAEKTVPEKIDPRVKAEIDNLKRREEQVKQHESAHISVAGQYANGGANYQYVVGPDGKRYIAGGEVSIDTAKIPDDPQATLKKAQTIRRAALAPNNPSAQDRLVAAQAARLEAQASQELMEKAREEFQKNDGKTNNAPNLFNIVA